MEFQPMENNYKQSNYQNNNYQQRQNNYQNNNRFNKPNFQKRQMPENAYTIYTDGGCFLKLTPPIGAWAFVDPQAGDYTRSNAVENTTNNKMELQAVIEALKYLKDKKNSGVVTGPFVIKSDSQYCVKGSAFWIKKWKKNNWKRLDAQGNIVGEVLNLDQWKEIDNLLQDMEVWFQHVEGHSGDKYNEMCDSIVKERMNNFRTN